MYVLNFWDGRLWLVGPMGQVSRCLRSPDEQADRDFLPGLPLVDCCAEPVALVHPDKAKWKAIKPYIQIWRDGRLRLVGPFENVELACAWADDRRNRSDTGSVMIGSPDQEEPEMAGYYILPWRHSPSLVGPFATSDQACDWAEDPANQSERDWRCQTTDFVSIAAPVTIVAPHRAVPEPVVIYIVDYSDLPCSLVGPFDNVKKARDWALASHGSSPGWGLIELDNPSPPMRIISPHSDTRTLRIRQHARMLKDHAANAGIEAMFILRRRSVQMVADAIERDRDLRPSVQRFGVECLARTFVERADRLIDERVAKRKDRNPTSLPLTDEEELAIAMEVLAKLR